MKRDATDSSMQLNGSGNKKSNYRKRETTADMKTAVKHFSAGIDAFKLRRLI